MERPLTFSQLEVVKLPYDPNTTIKVIAGPGSGKTLTLLHRIHHLIETKQVRPDEILVLSLTNKAVDNVIGKLSGIFEALSGGDCPVEESKNTVSQINVSTIHGLASKIVTENEGVISVIEENGWRGLMKLVSNETFSIKSSKTLNTKELQRLFKDYQDGKSKNKESMEKLAELMRSCRIVTNEELIKRASFYLDDPTDYYKNLHHSESTLTFNLKSKYKVLLIDEFQDLFPALLPFLCKIASQKQLALFGDPNQNIYEFLGSNQKVVQRLEGIHGYENLAEIYLHDNFRCTHEIMDVANRVIGKKASGSNQNTVLKEPCGVLPRAIEVPDSIDEMDFLINEISQLVCASARLSDIAILTRTNAHLESVAQYLRAYNIKFEKLTSHPDWLTDFRIQFLIDLLRMATIAHHEKDLENTQTPTKWKSDFSVIVTLSTIRGVSDQSIQRLYLDCRRKSVSFWRYLTEVPRSKWPVTSLCKQKIEDFIANLNSLISEGEIFRIDDPLQLLEHLCNAANNFDCNIMRIENKEKANEFKIHLEQMLQVMKSCTYDIRDDISLCEWFLESYFEKSCSSFPIKMASEGNEGIKISTIHSSKGLEFPVVFLMGTPHSVLPIESKTLYVGMTRARNLLYLTNIKHPQIPSAPIKAMPSLLSNENFWKYYSLDLNRKVELSDKTPLQKYTILKNRYGLNANRSYSTLCRNFFFYTTRYTLR